MQKTRLTCSGRCNGLGDMDQLGSYVRLMWETHDAQHGIVVSEGEAEVLVAELQGALRQKMDATVAHLARSAVAPKRS